MDSSKYKSVALSIDTYNILKRKSEEEDRTISGTIRHLLKKTENPQQGIN
jgi:macrodomain Ter protein organizer (MatP/YcbG family)|tara:strand:- start:68 stop:217 length:150 start_codon:yes stop_codon:yes gene_type:complete